MSPVRFFALASLFSTLDLMARVIWHTLPEAFACATAGDLHWSEIPAFLHYFYEAAEGRAPIYGDLDQPYTQALWQIRDA